MKMFGNYQQGEFGALHLNTKHFFLRKKSMGNALIATFLICISFLSHAQTNGDYRSAVASGNWNVAANWEKYNGGWGVAPDYPGQVSGAGLVTIRDGHSITLNISPTNAIGALTVGEGASGSLASDGGGNRTLTVNNNLIINAGGSYNLARTILSVTGTTTISGSLTDNNNNGSATFIGKVTVNSGGSFSTANNSAFTFRGGIDNDGTFSKTGTGAVTFNTYTQDIEGSQPITINGTVTVSGITVNNKSAALSLTRTAASALTGTGTWIQNSGSILIFSGVSINTGLGLTVDFSTNWNKVVYARAGAQTILGTTYHHLVDSVSGTKTLGGNVTVNGNLAIKGSVLLDCSLYQITGNASGTFTMDSGTSLRLGNTGDATNVLFPTNFTAGNITLNSASTVQYQNNATQTISNTPTYGHLIIATGGTKTAAGNLTIAGNLTVSAGTFDLGTTATSVNISGTAAITGTLSFNGTTTKTVTVTGNLSGAGTIDMSGGSLLHNLNLNGATNAITTFTTAAVASTVTYGRSGNQTVFGSGNYRNLVTSGSGTKSQSAAVTVNNDVTIGSGTSYDPVGQNLTVNGTTYILGTFAESNTGGTNNLQNVDISGGTINGTATDVTNINGNLTMPTGNGTIGRTQLTVSGTTTVPTGRSLTINSNTGAKTFTGEITIEGTGSWTSTTVTTAANMVIQGGIDVQSASGSFTAAAATFNGNQDIAGAGPVSFSSACTIGAGYTVTNLSTYGITFTNTITGGDAASTWAQGANSITYYQPSASGNAPMATGILNASATGNQFHYGRAGAQTIKAPSTSYYHLYVTGGAGTKTLSGNTVVDGDFSLVASTTFAPSTYDFTVSGTSTVAGTITDASATGTSTFEDVDLSSGTITGTATGIFNINGNLTMPSGSATLGRGTITVSGTTVIPNSYSLTLNNNNGVKRFDGMITANGSGTFTSTTITTTANLDLRGGINVVSSSGSFAAGAATLNNTQSISGAGAVSFNNAVTIGAGFTITDSNTGGVTFNNNLDGTDGTSSWISSSGVTVYYEGAAEPMLTGILDVDANPNSFYYSRSGAQNVKSITYHHLYKSGGSGTATLQGNVTVNGNLNIGASTSLNPAAHDITISGTTTIDGTFTDNTNSGTNTFTGLVDITATGTFTSNSASSNFIFEGGITNNGTFNKTGAGPITFTNNQTIAGASSMTMTGAVTITAGDTVTYSNTSSSGITLGSVLDGANSASQWKCGANSTVYYAPGNATAPMNTGSLDASASGTSFHYSRANAQTIKGATYHNLIISGSGTKTLGGNTTANGNLTITATLDVDNSQNYSLTVGGNFMNTGTFQPRNGTVTLNGTSNQSLTSNGSTFYNLVVNNSATQVSLNDNLTVSNGLTLTDGVITTSASYRVIMTSTTAASLSGFSQNSFINGNLRRYIATNTSTYTFPIGDGTASTDYYRADIINNNLAGFTYIDSRFKPLSGHNDSEMNVADTWEFGSLTYNTINTAGVWELEPNAAPSGGSYGIRLYIANMSGLVDNDFGPLKRPVGSTSGADWSTGGGTLNPNDSDGRTVSSGYMKRIGLTSFSEFGAGGGSSSGGGLPIELVSFHAVAVGNTVELKWQTETELNNDYFTIERSSDGETFTGIEIVQGAGNSSQHRNYETVDLNPLAGTSYYRLKQTDYNGAFTYSDVVSVTINKSDLFTISPNPVSDSRITLQLNKEEITGDAQWVFITDMSGKTVFTQNLQNEGSLSHALTLPGELSAGIYVLTVKCLNSTLQKKFLVK